MTGGRSYLIMKLVGREDHPLGHVDIDQWVLKYPDGTEKPFSTPEWDGKTRTPRLNVRQDGRAWSKAPGLEAFG